MPNYSPDLAREFVRAAKRSQCLDWFERSEDERVRQALRPLLFDPASGEARIMEDRLLQIELVRLVDENAAFRGFVEAEVTTVLDRITASYLATMWDGGEGRAD